MANVSSISSIDDCFYYHGSLVAMFCPSIVAVLIAFGNLAFQAVQKQKKETDKADSICCGSTLGNAVVLALIGLFYPIVLLLFSMYFGYRLFTGREQKDISFRENMLLLLFTPFSHPLLTDIQDDLFVRWSLRISTRKGIKDIDIKRVE